MKELEGIRKFSIPALDWNANELVWYYYMEICQSYEPFTLAKLDTDKLDIIKSEPFCFSDFPVNS